MNAFLVIWSHFRGHLKINNSLFTDIGQIKLYQHSPSYPIFDNLFINIFFSIVSQVLFLKSSQLSTLSHLYNFSDFMVQNCTHRVLINVKYAKIDDGNSIWKWSTMETKMKTFNKHTTEWNNSGWRFPLYWYHYNILNLLSHIWSKVQTYMSFFLFIFIFMGIQLL